jgi:hypothetical protein|tara:strand:+ start:243 stop:410 length:168 start_codon:yes stop_codon:yes gene_type:complete
MLAPKEEFIRDFMQGYLDGHSEKLEQMEPEDMERKLIMIEGYAIGFYDMLVAQGP